jgi:hypothetical protein
MDYPAIDRQAKAEDRKQLLTWSRNGKRSPSGVLKEWSAENDRVVAEWTRDARQE